MTYLLATWSAPVQAAMHIDWNEVPKCPIARHFDDLLHQATCDVSGDLLDLHPLSFHVRLNANDLDEPTYRQVLQCKSLELNKWQDAIDAELRALQEKLCFDVMDKTEAEG